MTVSRHFLRRRARQREALLQSHLPAGSPNRYKVERALRGPYRWRVVLITSHSRVGLIDHVTLGGVELGQPPA